MRKLITLSIAAVLLFAGAMLMAGEEAPWLDLHNCDLCKPITQHEGFMENVHWEMQPIANGSISISTYAEGFEEVYNACNADMMAQWEAMKAGEEMKLCGLCQASVAVMDETVKMESIKLSNGQVTLMTSDNPETVVKLQEIAKRTVKEMAVMMEVVEETVEETKEEVVEETKEEAVEGDKGDHTGHDHK
ncbi:MAG: hypothetical protein KOO62_13510 [candidate division Zixibacteria bacterium]|nr:hypothetical protein [candidate division Zixibacteria bacterium]